MAAFEAQKIRAISCELKERLFDLYATLLPIQTEVNDWMLNGSDPNLPTPFQVRVQVEAYEALTKATLRLTDWITEVKQAQPADYLTYPPPPVFFDGGTGLFDGGGNPDP
jgi:hypothetical protein